MADEQPRYIAYLLRLWQTRNDGRLVWLASVADPHSGARRGFGSVQELIAFLRDQTDAHMDRTEDAEAPRD
jgi:hypothetical protein